MCSKKLHVRSHKQFVCIGLTQAVLAFFIVHTHTLQLHNSRAETSWLNTHGSSYSTQNTYSYTHTHASNRLFATIATHLQVMYLLPRKSSNTIWHASYFILPAFAADYDPCCELFAIVPKSNGICRFRITQHINTFFTVFPLNFQWNSTEFAAGDVIIHVGDMLFNCHRSICVNIYSIFNLPFSIRPLTFVFIRPLTFVCIHMFIFRDSNSFVKLFGTKLGFLRCNPQMNWKAFLRKMCKMFMYQLYRINVGPSEYAYF